MPKNTSLINVKKSKIQGRGVFARTDIRKGTQITEYTGEIISQDEANDRYPDEEEMDRHHTFLFGVDRNTVIDATNIGNEARYINHSCDPNCEAVMEDKRIFIYAIKNIEAGAELVYDYNLDRPGRWQDKWWQQYKCLCGSKKCRGTIISASRKAVREAMKAAKKGRKNGKKLPS